MQSLPHPWGEGASLLVPCASKTASGDSVPVSKWLRRGGTCRARPPPGHQGQCQQWQVVVTVCTWRWCDEMAFSQAIFPPHPRTSNSVPSWEKQIHPNRGTAYKIPDWKPLSYQKQGKTKKTVTNQRHLSSHGDQMERGILDGVLDGRKKSGKN